MSLISKEILRSIVFDMDLACSSRDIGMWPILDQKDFIREVIDSMPGETAITIHDEVVGSVGTLVNFLDPSCMELLKVKMFGRVRQCIAQDVSDIIYAHKRDQDEQGDFDG